MGPNGEQPLRFLSAPDTRSTFYSVQWAPNGKRLAYGVLHTLEAANQQEQILQTRDLDAQSLTTLVSSPNLDDFIWLPDDRILYSVYEGDGQSENLWEISVNKSTGAPRSQPRQITNWAGFFVFTFSATADGRHLSFLKFSSASSIYVAEFDRQRGVLKASRRLTTTDSYDYPTDWTADGKAVVFTSSRNGHSGISKESLDRDSEEPLVPGAEGTESDGPRLSPDGKWILFTQAQKPGSTAERIMRVPVEGGTPELVFSAPAYNGVRCARAPADLCLFAEQASDGHQLVFSAFDPVKGRGRELTRFPADPNIDDNWNLSPDGKWLALVRFRDNVIHFLPLQGGQAHDLVIRGWPGLTSLDFAIDSKGLFVNSVTTGGSTLLYIDPAGKPHPLWQLKSSSMCWAIPSRGGKDLAILGQSLNSNLWMIENF